MQRVVMWMAVALVTCLAVIWWVTGGDVPQVVSIVAHGAGVARDAVQR